MRLDGVLADDELARRSPRSRGPARRAQDLALARRELGERGGAPRSRSRARSARSGGASPTARAAIRRRRRRGWRRASCCARRVLEQEPARAGAQRLVDVLVEVEGRQHEHARPRRLGARCGGWPRCRPCSGMRTSISTTSGVVLARERDRLAPSAASPTTSMSGSASQDHPEAVRGRAPGRRRPARGSCAPPSAAAARARAKPPPGRAAGLERAAVERRPARACRARPCPPDAGAPRRRRPSSTTSSSSASGA